MHSRRTTCCVHVCIAMLHKGSLPGGLLDGRGRRPFQRNGGCLLRYARLCAAAFFQSFSFTTCVCLRCAGLASQLWKCLIKPIFLLPFSSPPPCPAHLAHPCRMRYSSILAAAAVNCKHLESALLPVPHYPHRHLYLLRITLIGDGVRIGRPVPDLSWNAFLSCAHACVCTHVHVMQ